MEEEVFAESYDARTEYNTRLNVVNSADPNTAISESIGDIEYLLFEVCAQPIHYIPDIQYCELSQLVFFFFFPGG